jgi:putative oxidoreductase
MEPPLPTQSAGTSDRPRRFDVGLLLLRGTAAVVLLTWGFTKFHDLVQALNSSQALESWRFSQMVRKAGFPFPVFMAVCADLNESVLAGMVILGVLTRPAALIAALGWVGCLYVNFIWHQELLRPMQFTLIFAALAFLGAGRYSVDHALWSRRARWPDWFSSFGLLLLKVGAALASIALVIFPTMKQPHLLAFVTLPNWLLVVAAVGAGWVGLGLRTRWVAAGLSVFWVGTLLAGFLAGQNWNSYPLGAGLVGSALFAIIYGTLALTGPGRIPTTKAKP